jgi:membrane protein DedA with SNARE-associated domain
VSSRRARVAVGGVGLLAAAALVAVVAGVVQLPDLKGALTDLADRLGAWTYVLVAALAFLETGAFVGLVAPGETAVVLGGVVAAQGKVELAAMLLVAWSAAALGDLASFTLGRRLGRRFLLRRGPRLGVTSERLTRVEGFFSRHGAKAVLVGRFVGIVRAVAPFTAGASNMRFRAFVPWSLVGTAAWSAAFVLAGYAFSHSFEAAADVLTHGALVLAVVAAAVLLVRGRRQIAGARPNGPARPSSGSRASA